MIDQAFWRGRRVFLTGHTGFKGGWLALWLRSLGAEVTGYALPPPTAPSLFDLAGIKHRVRHVEGDIRDLDRLGAAMREAHTELVLHLAAQPIVRLSYDLPVETYATNVMGTVNLLEAVRRTDGIRSVLCITSDKCYDNREWVWGYRETDALGGRDPYSSSKGCAEMVASAYRHSYFPPEHLAKHGVAVATARAGNVIGGGDWASDRLVPDVMQAFQRGHRPSIRFPEAIRPWQHVLEPLHGYLLLSERLWHGEAEFAESWNFGPGEGDARSVRWVADRLSALWGDGAGWDLAGGDHPHEARFLKLDSSKARALLGWHPVWTADEALVRIVEWYRALAEARDMAEATHGQIEAYQASCTRASGVQAFAAAAASKAKRQRRT